MPRTEESFAATWKHLKWALRFHRKPCWLVPMEDDYQISFIKPDANALPLGTAANLYDLELNIIDQVSSTKSAV